MLMVLFNSYWAERADYAEKKRDEQLRHALRNSERHYKYALRGIEKDIQAFYGKYAEETGLTLQEATKALSGDRLQSGKRDLKNYPSSDPMETLSESYKARVTRLDNLKYQINGHIERLGKAEEKDVSEFLAKTYEDTYYNKVFDIFKGAGVGKSFNQMDDRKVQIALKQPWAVPEDNFSSRIWGNKARLKQVLDSELTRAVITGRNITDVVKDVSKATGASLYNASRLIQTEEAHMATMARDECYNELGVDRYRIVCTLDERTCPICGDYDRKVFNNPDRQEGVNCPPFHPHCRCVDAPYYDDMEPGERIARDADGEIYRVPQDMSYNEWKGKLIPDEKQPEKLTIETPEGKVKTNANFEEMIQNSADKEAIKDWLNNAPDDVREVWNKYMDNNLIQIGDVESDKAFFSPISEDVSFNIEKVRNSASRYGIDVYDPYSTVFHEIGHNIAHGMVKNTGIDMTDVDVLKYNKKAHLAHNDISTMYVSQKHGLTMEEMIIQEVDEQKKAMRKVLVEEHKSGEAEKNFNDAYDIYLDTFKTQRKMTDEELRGPEGEKLKLEQVTQHLIMQKYGNGREYEPKPNIDNVYSALNAEMRDLGYRETASLSDIWSCETQNRMKTITKHDTDYWEGNGMPASIEAFAEMYQSKVQNNTSGYEILFPKSYEIFNEILEADLKGKIKGNMRDPVVYVQTSIINENKKKVVINQRNVGKYRQAHTWL